MKIFGREPALIIGFIGAVLAAIVALNVPWMTAGQAAAVLAVLTGVVTAATTRPMAPGLFAGLVAAVAALFAQYGLHWSDAMIAAITSIVLAGFALFGVRNQVTPVGDAVPIAPAEGTVR